MKIYIDIQTRSIINLFNEGVAAYVAHPSFEILAMMVKQDEYYTTYFNDKFQSPIANNNDYKNYTTDFNFIIKTIEELNHIEGVEFIAHFAEFEITCLKKFIPDLDESKWFCTSKEAHERMLPRSLRELSIELRLDQRINGFKQLINNYCIPCGKNFTYKTIPMGDINKFICYCKLNIDLCEQVYDKFKNKWKKS